MRQINKIFEQAQKLSVSEDKKLTKIDETYSGDPLRNKSVWLIVDHIGSYLGCTIVWCNGMATVAQCSKRETLVSMGLDTGDHSNMENPLTLFRRKFAETNKMSWLQVFCLYHVRSVLPESLLCISQYRTSII